MSLLTPTLKAQADAAALVAASANVAARPTTPIPYASDVAPTQLASVAGYLRGYDLFCLAAPGRTVRFYDSAVAPGANAAPLVTIVLGAGRDKALALPGVGAPFVNGLWAVVSAIGSGAVPAAGDIAGSIYL